MGSSASLARAAVGGGSCVGSAETEVAVKRAIGLGSEAVGVGDPARRAATRASTAASNAIAVLSGVGEDPGLAQAAINGDRRTAPKARRLTRPVTNRSINLLTYYCNSTVIWLLSIV